MKKEKKIKLAKNNKRIPTKEIKQDILDTQNEIDQMKKEAKRLKAMPMGMRETRLNHMRGQAQISGIKSREIFIEKLNAILEARNK